jgi:apolipoprotein N-acyltransferase
MERLRGWRLAGVALVAGLLLTAGLPPFGWWPLALGGAALLAALVAGRPWRGRALTGFAAGIGFLAPGLFWMLQFSPPGYVLGVLIETGLFTLGVVAVPADRSRWWRWLGFPAALVLAEGLRGIWPFGGVPIATLAQTQIGGPLAPVVRLGGTPLLAALVALVGVAVAVLVTDRHGRRPATIALAAAAVLAAGGWVAPNGTPGPSLDAAMVQGGGERGTQAIDTSAQEMYQRHLDAMDDVGEVDLVLWPEDVVKVEGDVTESEADATMADLARRHDATTVVGTSERRGDRFAVMSTVWAPDGEAVSRYQKNQRVPFGEYVPFRPLIERFVDVSPIPRDSLEGTGTGIHQTPVGPLGVTISFEVFFPHLARAAILEGAEVLLVPTNATSYSTTQMPALTLASARLRALETGRYTVQAAPTGFSGVVDPDGQVLVQSDLGATEVIQATVDRRTGLTPYARLGDLPFVGLAVLALAAAWARPSAAGRPAGASAGAAPARREAPLGGTVGASSARIAGPTPHTPPPPT